MASPYASAAKIASAEAKLGGPIAQDDSLLLKQLVVALGNVTGGGGGGGSSALTGEVKIWTTPYAPTGYLLCDGSAVSRTNYAGLFAVIGTSYGGGDGSTTFNVPDFRDKVPVGLGPIFNPLTSSHGSYNSTISTSNLPTLSTTSVNVDSREQLTTVLESVSYGSNGAPIEVVQPSLVINFIIKT